MRALGIMAGAMLALAPSGAFAADVGATSGVPPQAGTAWGQRAPMPAGPAYAPAPMSPPPGAWQGAPSPWRDGGDYRRPVRGWKVPKHYPRV